MPIKATVSYHYPPIKMSKLKKKFLSIPSTGENTEQSNENSHLLLMGIQNLEFGSF